MISLIGVIVSLLSFAYGFIILFNTLAGHGTVAGFATIVALISFLLGMVIIMLGIIGEYLWRIFDETNKRPEAVIDEIY
jgi:dolichol-phosphate mannosyltransferase